MYKSCIEDFIRGLCNDRTKIVLAVVEKSSSLHMGNISLQQIDFMNSQAEIAFMFGKKEYWGKGFATRAAKLIINHAFCELGLHRIYFGTSELNVGMQKVGEKLGFQKVGILRQSLYKSGRYVDIYNYDLLELEWNSDNDSYTYTQQ